MLFARAQVIINKNFFENKTLTPEIFKKEFFVPNNINFFEFAMSELKKMQLAPGTRKTYKSKLKIFHKYTGDIDLNEITSPLLEKYRAYLLAEIQNSNSGEFSSGIYKLLWLEQNYNVVLMEHTGSSKSFIASGLIYEAVKQGYRAYFLTMEDLIFILKLKELTSTALGKYNRLLKAHLIAIDDIMMFPIKKHEAVAFFNFINYLHLQSSVIITTNKSPKQWTQTLEDEVLATALLDRLLFRCELIKLRGVNDVSYRMENREGIFENKIKADQNEG